MGSIRAIAEVGSRGTLVTASLDNTVKTWSLREGNLSTFQAHDSSIYDLAILDNTLAVTVSLDKTVKVIRLAGGRELASRSFPDYLYACTALNATSVVVGDGLGNLYRLVWNGRALNVMRQFTGAHEKAIWRMCSRGGGDTFATCSVDTTAKLWDSTTLALVHTFHGHSNWVYSLSYDADYLVTASLDRTIRVYSMLDYRHLTTIRTHEDSALCVQLVEGANVVLSGGEDMIIALHSLPSGSCIAKYDVNMTIHAMTLLASGRLAIAGWKPNEVKVLHIDELPLPMTAAVQSFRKALISSGYGTRNLTVKRAVEALNAALETTGVEIYVSVGEFEQLFLGVSDDISVSENKFIEIFNNVMKDGAAEERLKTEYAAIFQRYVEGRESVSIAYAARVLCHACKELANRGLLGVSAGVELENAIEGMANFDRIEDGMIKCDEFVEAALSIVHEIELKESVVDIGGKSKWESFRSNFRFRAWKCVKVDDIVDGSFEAEKMRQ